jgi:hypothetical protein
LVVVVGAGGIEEGPGPSGRLRASKPGPYKGCFGFVGEGNGFGSWEGGGGLGFGGLGRVDAGGIAVRDFGGW